MVWSEIALNRALVSASAIGILLILDKLVMIAPSLGESLSRWRGSENLEHSMSLRRARNLCAAVFFPPFCLILDRFGVTATSAAEAMGPESSVLLTFALMAGWLLLRLLGGQALRRSSVPREIRNAARHVVLGYMIVLTGVLLALSFILVSAGANPLASRICILTFCGATYLLALAREMQIFVEHGAGFSTFLYLCALDLLPTGILVACILIL